ncbi:MAG TPA: DUF4340 domain-containing protein [Bryobacteraceae bacterium]|nr:DUF4340 domain-containing protein [Bryobacteraceae bacterium]
MTELLKTASLAGAALVLAISAAVVEPEARVPAIMSDQGQAFYPKFTDPQAPRTIEVVDYDEATATGQLLKVQFQQGKWLITSHYNYRVDIGDRLAKTAAALMDLKKDMVRSDSSLDHAKYGVVDPLDEKAGGLTGRGKRVTLRDLRGDILADYILGKPVEGKPGYRYVRVPGQKRTYAVKTDADPSARFADWVNAGLLRIASSSIRKVTINRYNLDAAAGRLSNTETTVLTQTGSEWKVTSGEKLNMPAVHAMAAALDGLKIVDVRPKPPGLAASLRKEEVDLNIETALSLRQKGYFITPEGRVFSSEGDMTVETSNGLMYSLRFGEVASGDTRSGAPSDNRHLFVMVHFDPARAAAYGGDAAAGERGARELNDRFADWYYVISGRDFQNLRLGRAASQKTQPPPAAPDQ